MTRRPDELGPDDVRPLLALGVSRQAVADAMHVAFLFNVFDRLADAMGWDVPAAGSEFWASSAKMLLSRGYK
ncbi:MAG TPA: hypothetical protein VHS09_17195 [Polyangiaceae bacterium]|nr:hypothetical protein [Polyangiaceae bacterium]